jgi:hypothetical protein
LASCPAQESSPSLPPNSSQGKKTCSAKNCLRAKKSLPKKKSLK